MKETTEIYKKAFSLLNDASCKYIPNCKPEFRASLGNALILKLVDGLGLYSAGYDTRAKDIKVSFLRNSFVSFESASVIAGSLDKLGALSPNQSNRLTLTIAEVLDMLGKLLTKVTASEVDNMLS